MLVALADDVVWANGMDGGHVHGREALREYWTRQWSLVSPHVEPLSFHRTADGAIIAEVRQSVRDLEGKPLQGQTHGLKDNSLPVLGLTVFLVSAVAQTNAPPSNAGTRLITLGTVAGPPPRANRAQFSNLLIVNGALYVIDAGDGVTRRIAQAGFNVHDVGIIFITHHHDDHTAGLGTLMSVAWDNQRTKPINVYGPPKTEDLVKAAVQYFSISAEIRIADGGRTIPIDQLFFGHDVSAGVIYQDPNIKVTAIENTHFAFHKGPAAGKHKSYSYRFDTPNRAIVFTSDTGPFDELVEFAKGADVLVAEANSIEQRMQDLLRSGTPEEQARIKRQMSEGHLSTDDVGRIAQRAGVKTVILSHLTWKADDNYSTWAEEVNKHFSGPVLIARDLKEF